MKKLRTVIVGGFGHADAVLRELDGFEGIELAGLSPAYDGEDISRFAKLLDKHRVGIYENYQSMLSEVKTDVAIISTRPDIIPRAIIDAANAGCHIITEKPLALDMETLKKVEKTVSDSGVDLMAMLTMRAEPQFIAAKQVYDSGIIGEAVLINARKSYKWGNRPEWFGDEDKYGGTIGWVGIHAFDFIDYITGLTPVKLAAMKGNFAHRNWISCEDNCVIIFELNNGGHGTISIDYFRPEIALTHGDDWIRIVGTDGVLEASGAEKRCSAITNKKGYFQQPPPENRDRIFQRFLSNIIEGKDNTEMKTKSFMLTKICLLCRESAQRNSVIDVE